MSTADDLRQRVEPVECGAGHAAVEMYEKEAIGSEITYACPTCGRAIALELLGSEVERELVNEGELV
ncbi:hypothetical protein [Halosimplex amylolyticum]|uniref:hypothetical protein n=1 Tax=Halosimplex amylolyticum TaxID=3396616 RepID=UPI003F555F55